ncbi:MAG: glycosyltransferase [Sphingobacteriales bacterium]|nr:MAG: glycosyltransferase [Sphingobacteriales bacterium]
MLIVHIILWLLFIYLAAGTIYLFVIAIAGRFGSLPVFTTATKKNKIAVIIPSYKEDAIIVDTATKARMHGYEQHNFEVLVAADKLQPATVAALRAIPVQVLELDVNMKSRSVNAALQYLDGKGFDIAVILDADNIMGEGCLEKINDAYNKGYKALQCHRTAKNQQTPVALLDGMSEEININLFRRGPAVMNISAAPIGSGMAFEFGLLKEIFSTQHILNNPGEDREIDLHLMKKGIAMQFIDGAYVYDEKVASAAVFEKQRVRWLEAQVNHVRRFFDDDLKDTPKTAVYYNKFYQNLLLPRLLYIMVFGIFGVLAIASLIWGWAFMQPAAIIWLIVIGIYILTLIISIPSKFYQLATLKAIAQVPALMISMLKALLRIKKGRKEFLHTPKTFTNE